MKKRNLIIASTLATGLAVAAAAGAVSAHGRGGFGPGFDGPAGMAFDGPGFGGPGHLHGLMRALDLSDEQRDKIFDILHAQSPAARDKMKELRKGRDELHEATTARNYDARKVRELANAQAKTIADLIVMRTETFNKVYGLLTPEQQKKVAELKDGGGWRGHGPRGW
jgi:Spy/CpxP family protein refolding chaperone